MIDSKDWTCFVCLTTMVWDLRALNNRNQIATYFHGSSSKQYQKCSCRYTVNTGIKMCLAAQLILKRNQKKSQVKFSENCIVLVTSSKVYRRSVTNTENGEYPVPYLLAYKLNSCIKVNPWFSRSKIRFFIIYSQRSKIHTDRNLPKS